MVGRLFHINETEGIGDLDVAPGNGTIIATCFYISNTEA